jgi:hypothetical protein
VALIPKKKYPAQTLSTDIGYPHGKARNVLVPGDGTGTPWEADLINDIFGFQQALLAAASILPSEAPEKVGASQYLSAIQTLINKLTTTENTWTKKQTFNLDARFAADIYLRGERELFYEPATVGAWDFPVRKVQVPLTPTTAIGWGYSNATNPAWACSSNGAPFVVMVGRNVIPSGAIIRAVRVCLNTSIAITVNVSRVRYDTSTSNAGVKDGEFTTSIAAGPTAPVVLTVTLPAHDSFDPQPIFVYNEESQLMITVAPAASVGCALRWIEIEYHDQFLSNR